MMSNADSLNLVLATPLEEYAPQHERDNAWKAVDSMLGMLLKECVNGCVAVFVDLNDRVAKEYLGEFSKKFASDNKKKLVYSDTIDCSNVLKMQVIGTTVCIVKKYLTTESEAQDFIQDRLEDMLSEYIIDDKLACQFFVLLPLSERTNACISLERLGVRYIAVELIYDYNIALNKLNSGNVGDILIIGDNLKGSSDTLLSVLQGAKDKNPFLTLSYHASGTVLKRSGCGQVIHLRNIIHSTRVLKGFVFAPKIYISYGNDNEREDLKFCASLKDKMQHYFPFVSVNIDRAPENYMEDLSVYTELLKKGTVIIVLNQHYLESPYAMDELLGILDRDKNNRNGFFVIPMDSAKYIYGDTTEEIDKKNKLIDYWKNQLEIKTKSTAEIMNKDEKEAADKEEKKIENISNCLTSMIARLKNLIESKSAIDHYNELFTGLAFKVYGALVLSGYPAEIYGETRSNYDNFLKILNKHEENVRHHLSTKCEERRKVYQPFLNCDGNNINQRKDLLIRRDGI